MEEKDKAPESESEAPADEQDPESLPASDPPPGQAGEGKDHDV